MAGNARQTVLIMDTRSVLFPPGTGWNRSGHICIGAAKKAFRAPPMRGPEKVYLSGIAAASAVH